MDFCVSVVVSEMENAMSALPCRTACFFPALMKQLRSVLTFLVLSWL